MPMAEVLDKIVRDKRLSPKGSPGQQIAFIAEQVQPSSKGIQEPRLDGKPFAMKEIS